MNRPHYIKDNKQTRTCSSWIFVDTETIPTIVTEDEEIHEFRLGVALYWEKARKSVKEKVEILRFKEQARFWDWVEDKLKKRKSITICAHNMQFDIRALNGFQILHDKGFKLERFILHQQRFISRFSKDGLSIKLIDSLNFFQFSLAELGERFNCPKLEMPNFEDSDDKWFEYCENDVKILYTAMRFLIEKVESDNMGTMGNTISTLAFNFYRHRYMKFKILIERDDKRDKFERESYYGGRVIAYRRGTFEGEPFYILDVNNLYPFVMRNFNFPVKVLKYVSEDKANAEFEKENPLWCIAKVRLKTDKPLYPKRIRYALAFPVGEFETVLAGPELALAYRNGHIQRVIEFYTYLLRPIFKDYVDDLYAKRLEAKQNNDQVLDLFYKLLLNSLYGKFGQRREVWEFVEWDYKNINRTYIEMKYPDMTPILIRNIMGRKERFVGVREWENSFPAIAAYVTSYGRVYLLHLHDIAGYDNVYYCDTDSLIVNEEGYDRLSKLIDNKKLGYLKLVKSSDTLEIRGRKFYIMGDKIACKGVSTKAIKLQDNLYRDIRVEGLLESLYKNRLNKIRFEKITLEIKADPPVGYFDDDGFYVFPYIHE